MLCFHFDIILQSNKDELPNKVHYSVGFERGAQNLYNCNVFNVEWKRLFAKELCNISITTYTGNNLKKCPLSVDFGLIPLSWSSLESPNL